jgi:hypothetical protein
VRALPCEMILIEVVCFLSVAELILGALIHPSLAQSSHRHSIDIIVRVSVWLVEPWNVP